MWFSLKGWEGVYGEECCWEEDYGEKGYVFEDWVVLYGEVVEGLFGFLVSGKFFDVICF